MANKINRILVYSILSATEEQENPHLVSVHMSRLELPKMSGYDPETEYVDGENLKCKQGSYAKSSLVVTLLRSNPS
jgi:hypothetical protein